MQQTLFFEHEKKENLKKQESPFQKNFLEQDFKSLDFIVAPYAFLLGIVSTDRLPIDADSLLVALFSKGKKDSLEMVEAYLAREVPFWKRDPSKKVLANNALSPFDLKEIFIKGAVAIVERHGSIAKVRKMLRKRIGHCDPPLLFSLIPRYFNNGYLDERWYDITSKELEELFVHFDKNLIASIFSITSVRSKVDSNVTKALKALQQFFENKLRDVPVGPRKGKKIIKSYFSGFLDGSLMHLNNIKQGASLTDPAHRLKNGRKIKNFADAMLENKHAIVVDVWITRAFGCDRMRVFRSRTTSQSPTPAIYNAIERYLQTLGELTQRDPRGVCAMIWSGIRQEYVKGSTRYTEAIKLRLSHGLFEGLFGELKPTDSGLEFIQKK